MALTAEVLRSLIKHHGLGQSIQRTAKAVGLSASSVKKYFDRIATANLTWQEAKSRYMVSPLSGVSRNPSL